MIDFKKELYDALQDSSEIVSYNAKLRGKYEKQEKEFNRERGEWNRKRKKEKEQWDWEREQWNWDRTKWSKKLGGLLPRIKTCSLKMLTKLFFLLILNPRLI